MAASFKSAMSNGELRWITDQNGNIDFFFLNAPKRPSPQILDGKGGGDRMHTQRGGPIRMCVVKIYLKEEHKYARLIGEANRRA